MNKKCTECGKEKPLSEYHKHKQGRLGLNPKCKSCRKEFARTQRGKELQAVRGTRYRLTSEGKRRHIIDNKKHRKLWPNKCRAREAVNHAIVLGKLNKPSCCVSCGNGGILHGHHHSYEKEFWLDVEWLCSGCHSAVHKELKEVA